MWLSLVEFYRPRRVPQALRLLARERPRTVPLAGGTWLAARRDPSVEAVVDLSKLGLAHLDSSGKRMWLGAMVTLQDLATEPRLAGLASGLLADGARRAAPRSIRNMATLGGTLVAGDPMDNVLLALLVMEAQVHVRTPARKTLPFDVFLGTRSTSPPSGLITDVALPDGLARSGGALAEVSATPLDQPIVRAAAVVVRRGGVIRSVRLALGSDGVGPLRLPSVERELAGRALDPGTIEIAKRMTSERVTAPTDWRASAGYRREMAGVVVARALQQAWQRAAEA